MVSPIDQHNLQRHQQQAAQLMRQWQRWQRSEQLQFMQQTEAMLLIHIELLAEFVDDLYTRNFPGDDYARMVAYWAVALTSNDLLKQKMRNALAEDLSYSSVHNEKLSAEFLVVTARLNKEEMDAA